MTETAIADELGYPDDLVKAMDKAWGRRCNGTAIVVCLPGHLMRLFRLADSARVLGTLFGIEGETLDHAVKQLEAIVRRQVAEAERPIRPEHNFVSALTR
jgi:hypothetical protein